MAAQPPANGQQPANPANPTGSQTQSQTNSNSASPTIPQTAAAGGVSITQPPQTAAPSFYKIAPSQLITFGWNFTSLSVTPTALSVSAWCPQFGVTYPVGPSNGIIPGSASSVVWDPWGYEQQPGALSLAVATYTLQIMDSGGPNKVAQPGLFSPNAQLRFALYRPQPYEPLSSWQCTECSDAAPAAVAPHPLFLMTLVTLVALVFGGWGVLRRARV